MNGLGGLNKSPEGVVIGLVQLRLPVVVTRQDLARAKPIASSTWSAKRRNLARIVPIPSCRTWWPTRVFGAKTAKAAE